MSKNIYISASYFLLLSDCLVKHRRTSFYCALQILKFFLQTEGLWQPHVDQEVYPHHFPHSICWLCVSVLRFGNAHDISPLIIIICYGDLWCYSCVLCLSSGTTDHAPEDSKLNWLLLCVLTTLLGVFPHLSPAWASLFPEMHQYWK